MVLHDYHFHASWYLHIQQEFKEYHGITMISFGKMVLSAPHKIQCHIMFKLHDQMKL